MEAELNMPEKEKTNSEKLECYLKEIDSEIFPGKELVIKHSQDEPDVEIKAEAMHHFDEKKNNEDYENHYYMINNELDNEEEDEFALFSIAAHEVRHRVQLQTLKKEHLFTQENIDILDDIKYEPFEKVKSQNKKEISERLSEIIKEMEEKKKSKLSKNDYDAVIVASIARFLKRNELPTAQIAELLITRKPEDIKKGLEKIS